MAACRTSAEGRAGRDSRSRIRSRSRRRRSHTLDPSLRLAGGAPSQNQGNRYWPRRICSICQAGVNPRGVSPVLQLAASGNGCSAPGIRGSESRRIAEMARCSGVWPAAGAARPAALAPPISGCQARRQRRDQQYRSGAHLSPDCRIRPIRYAVQVTVSSQPVAGHWPLPRLRGPQK